VEESFEITQKWIDKGHRDYFSLAHLVLLFGKPDNEHEIIRNFFNSKAFYKFLSMKALELVLKNRKV
jgi:hypothetical protein